MQPREPTAKPTDHHRIVKRLGTGEMCKVLGVSVTPLKEAIAQGDDYFAQYCLDRCGVAYRAINVAKTGAKIPRWKFQEIY